MSVEVQKTSDIEVTRRPPPRTWRALRVRARKVSRAVEHRLSSSLTRRIVVLNLGGLVALLIGFLYLNQFRAGLIDSRVQSLATQGEIIASAMYAQAFYKENTPGQAKPLGVELNLGITYDTSDRFHTGFAYGLLLPFSGLNNPTPPLGLSGSSSIAHAMKFILAIPF